MRHALGFLMVWVAGLPAEVKGAYIQQHAKHDEKRILEKSRDENPWGKDEDDRDKPFDS
jgi:hypothetical protein